MRIHGTLIVSAAIVLLGGTAIGRWLDPTRRLQWDGLGRQPPFVLPDFNLLDEDGRRLSRQDLLGHVWVANFVFLQCGETCATMSHRIRQILRRGDSGMVRFVSFSVDPQDDAAALRRYRERWLRESGPQWRFAVADASLPALAVAMGLARSESDLFAALVATGRYFFVVDRKGVVRAAFDGLDESEARRLDRTLSDLGHEDE
jgi:protein SCO1/2